MTKQALIDPAPQAIPAGVIWRQLCEHGRFCPFCGYEVPLATFPWRYRRHDVHGILTTQQAPGAVCVGSRNVFTLDILGIGSLLSG
jgi:hypothetical protein